MSEASDRVEASEHDQGRPATGSAGASGDDLAREALADEEPAGDETRERPDQGPGDRAEGAGDDVVHLELVRERDEMRALAQRVQADFENYRKRVMRDQAEHAERATASLIEQLLPVLDSFDLAMLSLDEADEKVRKGVELVYADLLGVLERNGLERIPTDGHPFDPEVHEAVLHEPGEGEPTVVETMRTGYRLKGRVLRPAMVKVAG